MLHIAKCFLQELIIPFIQIAYVGIYLIFIIYSHSKPITSIHYKSFQCDLFFFRFQLLFFVRNFSKKKQQETSGSLSYGHNYLITLFDSTFRKKRESSERKREMKCFNLIVFFYRKNPASVITWLIFSVKMKKPSTLYWTILKPSFFYLFFRLHII